MRSRFEKRGFTLIELLVVIAIIAILASILFPVFAKAREKARQTTCLSQVRQLTVAIQMYSQDNSSKMPGLSWTDGLLGYIGHSNAILWCPSDTATKGTDCSYGYSGLMLTDTSSADGIAEAAITAPTEVGVLCDAEPAKPIAKPGIIGGGGLQDVATYAVNPKARHSRGIVVGYADGHAKFVNKGFEPKDMDNAVTRAFFMAPALGFVTNYGGGMTDLTAPPADTKAYILGGDSACEPIIVAAADAYKGETNAPYNNRGFNGMNNTVGRSGNYVWGNASGTPNVSGNSVEIGKDALVLIVSKSTKINTTEAGQTIFELNNAKVSGVHCMSSATIAYAFGPVTGTLAKTFQAYTFKQSSGSRAFFLAMNPDLATPVDPSAGGNGIDGIGAQALEVTNDLDMVDKVANDPYAIGYCSAAAADLERVEIIGFVENAAANGDAASIFPQKNPKYRYYQTDSVSAWPWARSLYADLWAAPDTSTIDNMPEYMLMDPNGLDVLHAGPLFQASYFVQ